MEVRPVDPTDINWAFDLPAYRVYFWKRQTTSAPLPEGVTEDRLTYSSYTYELLGCHNVREAFAWAEENRGPDRSYSLYACVLAAENRALIRLFGIDPTKHKGDQQLEWPGQVYI